MFEELLTAFTIGLVAGWVPGPVLATMCTETLQRGWRGSVRIIVIAILTELSVALFCLYGLIALELHEWVFQSLSIIGAIVLLSIARLLWRTHGIEQIELHFSTKQIVTMILCNAVLWTFWITIAVPKAILMRPYLPFGELAFVGLIELGWLISVMVIAMLFFYARGILARPRTMPIVYKFFSLTFVFFGLRMIYESATFFLS